MNAARSTTSRSAIVALLATLAFASVAACGEDGQATGSTCPPGSTLTYASFGQAFMQRNCLSCHTNQQSPTLTTQAAIQANKADIDRVAAAGPNGVNTVMPQGGSVSEDDRRKLGEWLACGAP